METDKIKNIPPGESFGHAESIYMMLSLEQNLGSNIILSPVSCYGAEYTSGKVIRFDPETEVVVLETIRES